MLRNKYEKKNIDYNIRIKLWPDYEFKWILNSFAKYIHYKRVGANGSRLTLSLVTQHKPSIKNKNELFLLPHMMNGLCSENPSSLDPLMVLAHYIWMNERVWISAHSHRSLKNGIVVWRPQSVSTQNTQRASGKVYPCGYNISQKVKWGDCFFAILPWAGRKSL